MKLLIDTNILLWILFDTRRLSPSARNAIKHGQLVLSVISYWEITLKLNKGRLRLNLADPQNWWANAMRDLNAIVLPLQPSHVGALRDLPTHHDDPFDRILIAQAISEGFPFVASDRQIHKYPLQVIW